ncbi:hypothetical protein HHK36_026771 [Tetracentron sinense]|uniref:Uncharacterized protein n=1 Tax=Tetracentron sinense TaxID=13715 RepID=A0A834YHH2_TETSI|nr:hypothetical protein HHK36_026771 [Tetracentron sinense]
MDSTNLIAVLAILLALQSNTALGDFLSPLLSPYLDDVCKDVECGKGTCKASLNHVLSFTCECESGWKQTRDDDDDNLKFLPCVIPNCTLDYSCAKASLPAPAKDIPINESFFDPCYWIYCGEGSCKKASKFKHKCECTEGYANILNVTAFPCFRECTLGMDCTSLGITVSNKTASSTPNLVTTDENQANSILPWSFHWLSILVMSLAMVLWK